MADYYFGSDPGTGDTQTVWGIWVGQNYAGGDEMTSTNNSYIWRVWTDNTGTANTNFEYNNGIWTGWVEDGNSTPVLTIRNNHFVQPTPVYVRPNLSLEEQQQMDERERLVAAAAEEDRKKQADAEEIAKKLLLTLLDKAQADSLEKTKKFTVKAKSGSVYEIRHGWAGNVSKLDEKGQPNTLYCIHPGIQIPRYDNMIAQKLLIESDEKRFLAIANAS